MEIQDECIEKEDQVTLIEFQRRHENQLTDLRDHLEIHCNVFLLFGSNRRKYDKMSLKDCLLPFLVLEQKIKAKVIKKPKRFCIFQVWRCPVDS